MDPKDREELIMLCAFEQKLSESVDALREEIAIRLAQLDGDDVDELHDVMRSRIARNHRRLM